MKTNAGKEITPEQIEKLAARKKIDKAYQENAQFGLDLFKDPKVLNHPEVKNLVEQFTEAGLQWAKDPNISSVTIGVINIHLAGDEQTPDATNGRGMLEHLHWLAMDRVDPNQPTQEEYDFCERVNSIFNTWFFFFLDKYNPSAYPKLSAINEEKIRERLGLVQFTGRDLGERFFREGKRESAEVVKAKEAFKAMNKPAPEGTVKELAARFGVSLSEIRRRKNEGTLHELAAAQ